MALSEWIFILRFFFLLLVVENTVWKELSTVKHGLHYTSAMKSSIRVSELIYSAKAEKTFLAQSQVPPAILEKHEKFIYVWVLAS